MEDLTKKLKVSDTVYMPLRIEAIDNNGPGVRATTNGGQKISFHKDGRYLFASTCPDIVLSVNEYPKVMEVSDHSGNWITRVVIAKNSAGFTAYTDAETLEEADTAKRTSIWKYAREIQPEPKRVKLTIQEIADKIGVDAALIDIVKG